MAKISEQPKKLRAKIERLGAFTDGSARTGDWNMRPSLTVARSGSSRTARTKARARVRIAEMAEQLFNVAGKMVRERGGAAGKLARELEALYEHPEERLAVIQRSAK